MSRRRAQFAIVCAVATIIILLLAAVGGQDYADAQRDAAVYCERVADGSWPDYKGTYKQECKP